MTMRAKVIKVLDKTFKEVEPSGKTAMLGLEMDRLIVVTRQFYDDVRHLLDRSVDPDFDLNDAKIAIHAIRRSYAAMDNQPDK